MIESKLHRNTKELQRYDLFSVLRFTSKASKHQKATLSGERLGCNI